MGDPRRGPNQDAVVYELRRVLKPDGRLAVGEIFGDPHMVTFDWLCAHAEAAGQQFEQRLGGRLAYLARSYARA